ncbi:MAG: hypothetical protein EBV06_06115 [Planctomycetia bacterium]|nr:hypothetical protein [Planctomycetia bacterium]
MRPLMVLFLAAGMVRADAFDLYLNKDLDRLIESGKLVKEIKQLTPNLVLEHDRAIPRAGAAMLILKTNGDRFAKLLVTAGKQKLADGKAIPILLIERFVTYKEGEERQIIADGKNLALFHDFRLGLDMGQVVPEAVGGDLRFVVEGDKVYAEPLGKAKLYVVVEHDKTIEPKRGDKFAMGDKVEPRHFSGSFKLFDDGRRSGRLVLIADDDGKVSGAYYSDRDGAKYEVNGRIGPKPHLIEFAVRFPRTEQLFRGMLFTGGGKALAGTSRMAERESAFYALREE